MFMAQFQNNCIVLPHEKQHQLFHLSLKHQDKMDAILPYLLNTVLGAGGAWLTNNFLKKNNLGMVGNLLSGVIGGNALPLIISAIMGGGDNMVMNIITALLGGGLGSVVGGLLKKAPGAAA